jgi:hypothetical protein
MVTARPRSTDLHPATLPATTPQPSPLPAIRRIDSSANACTPASLTAPILVVLAARRQKPDQGLAFRQPGDFGRRPWGHLHHNVGRPCVADRRAGDHARLIRYPRTSTCARLHHHLDTVTDQAPSADSSSTPTWANPNSQKLLASPRPSVCCGRCWDIRKVTHQKLMSVNAMQAASNRHHRGLGTGVGAPPCRTTGSAVDPSV